MITDSFDAAATAFPDRVFVQGDDLRMSYREAAAASHAIAARLGRFAQPGAHVALLSPNHPMMPPSMLGIMRSGAVYVPLNARDAMDDIIWFARFCEISVLICHSQYAHHVERMRSEIPTVKLVIGLTEPPEANGESIAQWVRGVAGEHVEVRRRDDDIALIKSSGGTPRRPKACLLYTSPSPRD